MHGPILWKNIMKIPLGDYGICIKYLWHISYAIKLWYNNAKEGFVKGLVLGWWTMCFRCGIDCGYVGMNLVNSGDQGGAFMAPWKVWEMNPICLFGYFCDSLGSSSCLCGFSS